jgi:anaerobic selenocysteine-containing dehydrogenase
MLFVYNSNALVTAPDQGRVLRGLERDDLFTVVFDQVMTDTARYADVVLPATTFLEGYDLARGYGPISLRLGQPVIERIGESRPNADVFGELLERLDLVNAGGRDRAYAPGDRRGPAGNRGSDATVWRQADPVSGRLAADV